MPAHTSRRRAGWLIAVGLTASGLVGLQAVQNVAHAADKVNPATGLNGRADSADGRRYADRPVGGGATEGGTCAGHAGRRDYSGARWP